MVAAAVARATATTTTTTTDDKDWEQDDDDDNDDEDDDAISLGWSGLINAPAGHSSYKNVPATTGGLITPQQRVRLAPHNNGSYTPQQRVLPRDSG